MKASPPQITGESEWRRTRSEMTVDEEKAKWKSEYEGETYYFCAERCRQTFDKNPKRFVG